MAPLIRPAMERVPAPVFGILLFTVRLLLLFCGHSLNVRVPLLVLGKQSTWFAWLVHSRLCEYDRGMCSHSPWGQAVSQMYVLKVFSAFRVELPLAGFSPENRAVTGCNCILRESGVVESLFLSFLIC